MADSLENWPGSGTMASMDAVAASNFAARRAVYVPRNVSDEDMAQLASYGLTPRRSSKVGNVEHIVERVLSNLARIIARESIPESVLTNAELGLLPAPTASSLDFFLTKGNFDIALMGGHTAEDSARFFEPVQPSSRVSQIMNAFRRARNKNQNVLLGTVNGRRIYYYAQKFGHGPDNADGPLLLRGLGHQWAIRSGRGQLKVRAVDFVYDEHVGYHIEAHLRSEFHEYNPCQWYGVAHLPTPVDDVLGSRTWEVDVVYEYPQESPMYRVSFEGSSKNADECKVTYTPCNRDVHTAEHNYVQTLQQYRTLFNLGAVGDSFAYYTHCTRLVGEFWLVQSYSTEDVQVVTTRAMRTQRVIYDPSAVHQPKHVRDLATCRISETMHSSMLNAVHASLDHTDRAEALIAVRRYVNSSLGNTGFSYTPAAKAVLINYYVAHAKHLHKQRYPETALAVRRVYNAGVCWLAETKPARAIKRFRNSESNIIENTTQRVARLRMEVEDATDSHAGAAQVVERPYSYKTKPCKVRKRPKRVVDWQGQPDEFDLSNAPKGFPMQPAYEGDGWGGSILEAIRSTIDPPKDCAAQTFKMVFGKRLEMGDAPTGDSFVKAFLKECHRSDMPYIIYQQELADEDDDKRNVVMYDLRTRSDKEINKAVLLEVIRPAGNRKAGHVKAHFFRSRKVRKPKPGAKPEKESDYELELIEPEDAASEVAVQTETARTEEVATETEETEEESEEGTGVGVPDEPAEAAAAPQSSPASPAEESVQETVEEATVQAAEGEEPTEKSDVAETTAPSSGKEDAFASTQVTYARYIVKKVDFDFVKEFTEIFTAAAGKFTHKRAVRTTIWEVLTKAASCYITNRTYEGDAFLIEDTEVQNALTKLGSKVGNGLDFHDSPAYKSMIERLRSLPRVGKKGPNQKIQLTLRSVSGVPGSGKSHPFKCMAKTPLKDEIVVIVPTRKLRKEYHAAGMESYTFEKGLTEAFDGKGKSKWADKIIVLDEVYQMGLEYIIFYGLLSSYLYVLGDEDQCQSFDVKQLAGWTPTNSAILKERLQKVPRIRLNVTHRLTAQTVHMLSNVRRMWTTNAKPGVVTVGKARKGATEICTNTDDQKLSAASIQGATFDDVNVYIGSGGKGIVGLFSTYCFKTEEEKRFPGIIYVALTRHRGDIAIVQDCSDSEYKMVMDFLQIPDDILELAAGTGYRVKGRGNSVNVYAMEDSVRAIEVKERYVTTSRGKFELGHTAKGGLLKGPNVQQQLLLPNHNPVVELKHRTMVDWNVPAKLSVSEVVESVETLREHVEAQSKLDIPLQRPRAKLTACHQARDVTVKPQVAFKSDAINYSDSETVEFVSVVPALGSQDQASDAARAHATQVSRATAPNKATLGQEDNGREKASRIMATFKSHPAIRDRLKLAHDLLPFMLEANLVAKIVSLASSRVDGDQVEYGNKDVAKFDTSDFSELLEKSSAVDMNVSDVAHKLIRCVLKTQHKVKVGNVAYHPEKQPWKAGQPVMAVDPTMTHVPEAYNQYVCQVVFELFAYAVRPLITLKSSGMTMDDCAAEMAEGRYFVATDITEQDTQWDDFAQYFPEAIEQALGLPANFQFAKRAVARMRATITVRSNDGLLKTKQRNKMLSGSTETYAWNTMTCACYTFGLFYMNEDGSRRNDAIHSVVCGDDAATSMRYANSNVNNWFEEHMKFKVTYHQGGVPFCNNLLIAGSAVPDPVRAVLKAFSRKVTPREEDKFQVRLKSLLDLYLYIEDEVLYRAIPTMVRELGYNEELILTALSVIKSLKHHKLSLYVPYLKPHQYLRIN